MLKTPLRGTTALICLSLAMPAMAQDTPGNDGPGYLGTLVMTPGKRDLSFGTALPRTVIESEEVEDRQASTVAQLIDSVPGVSLVNGTTPQGSGINIRGFGANTTYGSDQKIAIQIDGASVGSEELYRIGTQLFTDPLLYKQAEVLRGTIGSFAYGSGIVGGVVKLETKDASDFTGGAVGFAGSQTLEFSENGNGIASSTTLAYQATPRAEFLLNYTLRDQDDLTAGDGSVIGNSAFNTPSWLAKAAFSFGQNDEHRLTFSHSQTVADDRNVPYDQFVTTAGAFGNVDRLTDTAQTALDYRYDPASDLVDLRVNLSHADQDIESDYVPGSSPLEGSPFFGGILALADADHRYETTKLTVKNRALFSTGALSHDLTAGAELIRKTRADEASAPGGTDNRVALFAVNEMTLGGLTVTPALRYESSTVESATGAGTFENDALMGGLALGYEFTNGLSIFASGAYTEGLPIIDDLGTTATSIDRMNTTEKSRTFEIGAEYAGEDLFTPGDRFSIRGNAYDTHLWDITSYTVAGSMTQALDRVEMRGFELEASYGLENGLYFDFAGHVGEGEEVNPDGSATTWRNLPADRFQLTAGRRFGEALDVSWEMVRATDRRDSVGDDRDPVTLHNLRATWRPDGAWLAGTELRAGIENLTDESYVGHLASPTRPAPGRTFKLSLTRAF
jgi:hemoglobin/transferrin/lactoferrin receptor protein